MIENVTKFEPEIDRVHDLLDRFIQTRDLDGIYYYSCDPVIPWRGGSHAVLCWRSLADEFQHLQLMMATFLRELRKEEDISEIEVTVTEDDEALSTPSGEEWEITFKGSRQAG